MAAINSSPLHGTPKSLINPKENIRKLDCDIYITGSNAKLLSGELETYLAGRYVDFVIYPFSFAEFIELYHTVFPDASLQQCFNR